MQGLPSNVVMLYDSAGNPVEVLLDQLGHYSLAVKDETTQKILDLLSQNTEILRGILTQLAVITGSTVGLE